MERNDSSENSTTKKAVLNSVGNNDSKNHKPKKNRRGVLKGTIVSLLSTFGLSGTTVADPGDHVKVNKENAQKAVADQRKKLQHLYEHEIIEEANISKIATKSIDEGTNKQQIQAEMIQGPNEEVEPALTVTTEGPKGEISMWFPLNSDYAAFDLPDSVDNESINRDWNNQVSVSADCPDGNENCCCNVASCDHCHCDSFGGYCDCSTIADSGCWYSYCDCCPDPVNYCTLYCPSPFSGNC